ncbi:hypothetical protein B0A58_07440 [Flavobacterium branchiophilum NBRC 15030 = ATCC 35035]|uniref:DUF6046 domain-containing protein n=1 Tax=Flavobacterium branchiophilum TaxID=55197 RepID=A0A543G115_9FLAO|nr:DUF6046 domain-containing protein [Flavobacterium branchiophilum]OXA76397.1 hypothetical protein B0A58_07440 [Flavobacterium branchiophilum NBRC 15030 = ATCC 35035]TQM39778.1 hypothetical protein BC670_0609 [Flavobacterium branchiophilum]GEM55239.1 hypothetical protein FB1_14600 [Flavobacterium branchiophilum NBRC 15030 = ATCC 35035]
MEFFFGLITAKPFDVKNQDIKLNGSDWIGVPTLTSLAFEYKDKRVELHECIITINQEKNIVTTPLQGRDGTIKEYISDGDYTISIDAAVCSYVINQNGDADYTESHTYPITQLQELISFLKIKDTLKVQSDFLTLFGVTDAVVKSYGMVQETHSNRQSFQIQMLSDTAYEIKIKQDATII